MRDMKNETVIEFVNVYDGEVSFGEALTSLIVNRILRKMEETALPKDRNFGYNNVSVPMSSAAPGSCEGEE